MKTHLECIPCFTRQALQAATFSGADDGQKERILRKTLRMLDNMPWNTSPMEMARSVHGMVRREMNIDDPYQSVKIESNHQAMKWYASLADEIGNIRPSVKTAIRLAIAGNIVDYGASATVDLAGSINKLLTQSFGVSNKDDFIRELARAETIAYLADNAGEIVFDRLFMETINAVSGPKKWLLVTRKEPFINDVLPEDANAVGLTYVPGVELAAMDPIAPIAMTAPEDCKLWHKIRTSDVIISKGQGNYEAFSGESGIYFLLVAKCPVIARDLKSRTGSPVETGDIILWKS